MLNNDVKQMLLSNAFNAAVRAGAQIMKIYHNREDYDMSYDSTQNSITTADRVAHETIKSYLGKTRIPIMSEDGRKIPYEERKFWDLYWLVDPLDGTREFIKGNGEFTVNIALIENNICIQSVVYVPALNKIYVAERGTGAFVKENVIPDAECQYTYLDTIRSLKHLPLTTANGSQPLIALSRSHQNEQSAQIVEQLRSKYPDLKTIEQGSSYKFCLLAEGAVDFYPRTTETYEWDTAAGELILEEAGGKTFALGSEMKLSYNKEDLRNPWFECYSNNSLIAKR